MNRYFIIIILGIALGFLGIETGVLIINYLPQDLLLSDSATVFMLPLLISFLPFVIAAMILIFYYKGFGKYLMGLAFSITYYIPFQYRALFLRPKSRNEDDPLDERLITTAIVIIFLTALYCVFIAIKNKRRT